MAAPSAAGSASAAAARSGSASRYSAALAIIPSVVSMPPNSSTAALEMTCSVDRTPAPAAAASSDE